MMSRQQRLINLPLVGTIFLCLLVGVYFFAWRRFAKPAPAATIVKHSVETPADDALKYWTADKMRKAKPAQMPNVKALKREKRHSRRSPRDSRPQQA